MKRPLIATLATLSLAVTVANTAQAAQPEFKMPKLTMFSSIGAVSVEDKDFDPEAFELEIGVKGLVKLDEFKMAYSLIADVSDAINSKDTGGTDGEADIHISTALVAFPTQYGTFVAAPRVPSGQLRDLYGNVNIFEYNEAHSGETSTSGMSIFNQASEGQDVIAYVTPAFNNIKVTVASISLSESNGIDTDVFSVRALYDDKKLNIGLGLAQPNKGLAGADTDYKRYAFTAGYNFDSFSIGTTYEMNKDTFGPNGDFNSYGVVGRYYAENGLSLAAGYYKKDSDVDANDNNGVVVQVKKDFSKNVAFWVEAADYDNTPDNLAAGVNLKF